MRFIFCGGLDCPDWVLAEMAALSRMTSVKAKQLCNKVLKDITGEQPLELPTQGPDAQACAAMVRWILVSAAKYNAGSDTLNDELQQLGLPKEHATALCRVYNDGAQRLQSALSSQSLRLSRHLSLEWRVDYILGSGQKQDEVNQPQVYLTITKLDPGTNQTETRTICVSKEKFRMLVQQLKVAQGLMVDLKNDEQTVEH